MVIAFVVTVDTSEMIRSALNYPFGAEASCPHVLQVLIVISRGFVSELAKTVPHDVHLLE